MVSRFESSFQTRVVPVALRAFGLNVDLITADGSKEYRFTGMLNLEDLQEGEGFSDLRGRLTIRTSDLLAKVESFAELQRVRINDEIFHVYGHKIAGAGLTVFNIRRKASEQQHSNIFDINDQQATWYEE